MVTKQSLEQELHQAMRSGDELRKRTVRMALSAIKLAEVEARGPLDQAALMGVLRKEIKTRLESIHDAQIAGRAGLVEQAQQELELLEGYLPPPLGPAELEQLARDAIAETGASSTGQFGEVMKALMPRVQGRADGKLVGDVVRSLLTPS
ncbi:MAG TPA: GatB/YqeY domain-containing protein [Anaerolineales bacterium]|nr:GatB/YqeY domain-containing protein [Anaerolineales bacterium]